MEEGIRNSEVGKKEDEKVGLKEDKKVRRSEGQKVLEVGSGNAEFGRERR